MDSDTHRQIQKHCAECGLLLLLLLLLLPVRRHDPP